MGLPLEHNESSRAPVVWRYCNVATSDKEWATVEHILDAYAEKSLDIKRDFEARLAKCQKVMHAQRSRRRKVHAPGIHFKSRVSDRSRSAMPLSVVHGARRCSSQCLRTVHTDYVTQQDACGACVIGLPCRRAALALQWIWTIRPGLRVSWTATIGAATVKMTKRSGRSEGSESNEHQGSSLHWLDQRHKAGLCAAHEHLEAAADGPCTGIACGSA